MVHGSVERISGTDQWNTGYTDQWDTDQWNTDQWVADQWGHGSVGHGSVGTQINGTWISGDTGGDTAQWNTGRGATTTTTTTETTNIATPTNPHGPKPFSKSQKRQLRRQKIGRAVEQGFYDDCQAHASKPKRSRGSSSLASMLPEHILLGTPWPCSLDDLGEDFASLQRRAFNDHGVLLKVFAKGTEHWSHFVQIEGPSLTAVYPSFAELWYITRNIVGVDIMNSLQLPRALLECVHQSSQGFFFTLHFSSRDFLAIGKHQPPWENRKGSQTCRDGLSF